MTRPTIIKRKGTGSLSTSDKYEIIQRWLRGEEPAALSKHYDVGREQMRKFISRHATSVIDMYETRKLIASTHVVPGATKTPAFVNKEFKDALSAPNGTLTDQENLYCYLYVVNGMNNSIAMDGSGFDTGVTSDMSKATCIKLRGQYLRTKANVRDEIRRLSSSLVLDEPITKEFIQRELVSSLRGAQEEGKDTTKILRMLGDSETIFVQRIETTDVKPKEEMDALFELQKEDTFESSYTIKDTEDKESEDSISGFNEGTSSTTTPLREESN